MSRIVRIGAREILDSRGRPTVEAEVALDDGAAGLASVPSGASTGQHEARELRDGGARYGGLGVATAVAHVTGEIAEAVDGADALDQAGVDRALVELDGTPDKSRLGANAILAVSLATARAAAASRGLPLWRHLAGESAPLLPLPMVNIISGGLHADGGLDFQDFLIVPVGAATYRDALETCVRVRDETRHVLRKHGLATLKADEGGFGPELPSSAAALEILVEAIERAGRTPGEEVALALDVAATHFHDARDGLYRLERGRRSLCAAELLDLIEELLERFPVVSVEDPVAEDDWEGWSEATRRFGRRVQLVGDDLFTTDPSRLARGVAEGAANAVLVKMNQIGTLTETAAVVELARSSGYRAVVSARSGETEDTALADLAVALGAGQIKVGSVAQSERLAKYNRLLRIEEALGSAARFAGSSALRGPGQTPSREIRPPSAR